MSTTHANKIDIIKAATSKINEVDFENLASDRSSPIIY
jgi:branched-chain amino acid aminotransferase